MGAMRSRYHIASQGIHDAPTERCNPSASRKAGDPGRERRLILRALKHGMRASSVSRCQLSYTQKTECLWGIFRGDSGVLGFRSIVCFFVCFRACFSFVREPHCYMRCFSGYLRRSSLYENIVHSNSTAIPALELCASKQMFPSNNLVNSNITF